MTALKKADCAVHDEHGENDYLIYVYFQYDLNSSEIIAFQITCVHVTALILTFVSSCVFYLYIALQLISGIKQFVRSGLL